MGHRVCLCLRRPERLEARRARHLIVDAATTVALPSSFRDDKLRLARALARTPWSGVVAAAERRLGLMRVFVTHGTPPRYASTYIAQLDRLLERYRPLDPYRLEEALRDGPPGGRPACVFTFDDALLNNYEVAAVELERRGARGIFSVPVDFPSLPADEQPAWFHAHVREGADAEHETDDDLHAMSWEQVRDLVTRGHRVCCHTASHRRIDKATPPETVHAELVDARAQLEERLGTTVDGLCWPVEYDPRATAAIAVARSTYRWTLVTDTSPLRRGHDPYVVNRTRIEASWPVEAVDFQVSGAIDAAFIVYRLRAALARRSA